MSEIFFLKINLQRATVYGEGTSKYPNSKQRIYITGKTKEPVIHNNKIVLKEGRRVQVLYYHNNLKLALESIAKFNGSLTFMIESSADDINSRITLDNEGNELPKFDSDKICEQ